MSCVVMYQPYPTSSPYLLPSGPPGPPPAPTGHQLPPLSGFDRIPSTASAVPSASVTPPVNSPQSPSSHHQQQHQHHHHHPQQQQQQQQQRLPPTNGLPHGVEPKIEKNLDIGSNPGDAYGHMLAAAAAAAASRVSSETAVSGGVVSPHSPNNAPVAGGGVAAGSSNSRPGSAHHVQHRRDSEHEQQVQQQHPTVGDVKNNSSEHQDLVQEHCNKRPSPGHTAQYVQQQNNQVVITNYGDGGVQGEIERHFQRALNYNNATGSGASGGDDTNVSGEKASNPTPMNQRGLPASFWQVPQPNLNGANSSGGGHHGGNPASATSVSCWPEIYSDQLQQQAAVLNQLGPEWQYLSAQSAHTGYASAVNRSAAAHYSNYSRFQQPAPASSYWAAASRLAASQVKGEWGAGDYQATAAALSSAAGLHAAGGPASDFTHPYGSAAASAAIQHYSNMTGLETSMQDTSKELYWHGSF